jgi:hypothetical protein
MNSFQLGLLIVLMNCFTFGSPAYLDSINGSGERSKHPLMLCAIIDNHKMRAIDDDNKNNFVFSCSYFDETNRKDVSSEIQIETRSNNPYSPYYYEKFHRTGGTKNQRKLKFMNKNKNLK